MNRHSESQPDGYRYEIRVQGLLDRRWAERLDVLTVTPGDDGTTLIRGPVLDQPGLHGLLARIRDLGVPLISVNRVDPSEGPSRTVLTAPSEDT